MIAPSSSAPASSAQIALSAYGAGMHTAAAKPKDAAMETAREFETVFLTTMFNQMFSGLKTDGPFGGGYGEEVFREMLAGEYAKNVSNSGGIGLAEQVYREILSLQESAQ